MSWWERLFGRAINQAVQQRVSLALSEADGFFEHAGQAELDRSDYDRQDALRQALLAWRLNPLARRAVSLTTQYVVGGGLQVSSDHPATHAFLQIWWNHPLNQLPARVYEWCDELVRSGELFIALSTNAAGVSFARAVPAAQIAAVECAENDYQQELAYREHPPLPGAEGRRWPAYLPEADARDADGSFPAAMLHFAINRPAGAVRGESDLAPLLKWITRYTAWLEDRARLNRFRQTFLYVVRARFATEAERQARQAALNARPPSPGSILVTDESESWETISPQLDSFEAREDGLALKKMIAAGAGVPLHFLAEPEGTTRTTAESAGGPTFRHFEQRQQYFTWLVGQVAAAAVRRRALVDTRVDPGAAIEVRGGDLSARDNVALAQASAAILGAYTALYDRGLIDGAELVRVGYRFAGEMVDAPALLDRARQEARP